MKKASVCLKAKFGNFPSYAGYTSYDEVYYIADAVKRAGTTDADKLVEALEETDWEGTIGRIQFYGKDDPFTHSIKYGKGLITGLMALVPGGAPLCFTLVSVYLVASGAPINGAALLVWGSTELFIVDKTLRPKLVGGPIKLPFLPTFFGLVGGVKTMGVLGLFLGPVLMALLVSIWREWLYESKNPNELER